MAEDLGDEFGLDEYFANKSKNKPMSLDDEISDMLSGQNDQPTFSQLMQGITENAPPEPRRAGRAGFAGIGDDIHRGLSQTWPAVKGAAGSLKDLIIEQMTPKFSRGFDDFADRDIMGMEQQDPLENYKIALAGLSKGGNALGNMQGNIQDYVGEKFPGMQPAMDVMNMLPPGMGGQMSIPGMPDSEYDYLDAVGAPAQDDQSHSQQFLYEIMKRLPLTVSSGFNPYVIEGQRAVGENENPIPALATVGAFEGATKAAKAGKPYIEKTAEAVKNTLKVPDWLTKDKAGRTVGEPAKALSKELSQGYEDFKQQARDAGIKGNTKEAVTRTIESDIVDPTTGKNITKTVTTLEAPSFEKIQKQLDGVDLNVQESVHRAYETGDIGDIINAEKDLGTYKNNAWNDFWQSNKPLDRNGLHRATKMETKLNKIIKDVGEKLSPGERNKIIELRERYHRELAPYSDIEPIARYIDGDITAADLTRRLQANTKAAELFRARLAKEHKAIGRNAFKNKLIALGIKGSLLGKFMSIAVGG